MILKENIYTWYVIYRSSVEGGVFTWKELTSLKRDKEKESMVLEREWRLSLEEIY